MVTTTLYNCYSRDALASRESTRSRRQDVAMNTTRTFSIRLNGTPSTFYRHTVTPAQLQFVVLMYLVNHPINRITVFQHIGPNERHPFAVAWIHSEVGIREDINRILRPEYYIRDSMVFSIRRIKADHDHHFEIVRKRLQYTEVAVVRIQSDTISEDINLIADQTPEIILEYIFI